MKEKKKTRVLAIFFISMIVFTFLSRAADSITVAKVAVAKIEQGTVSYTLNGTGVVKEQKERKIRAEDGYVIKKLGIKKGDKIEKGQLLFVYDLKTLEEKKKVMEKEEEKLKLEYEKAKLGNVSTTNQTEIEQLLLEKRYAEEDLEAAKNAVEQVKEEIEKKKQIEQEDAEKEYKQKEKEIEKEQKEVQREIESSIQAIEQEIKKQEVEKKNAERAIRDAQNELEALDKPIKKVDALIQAYVKAMESNQEVAIEKAKNDIFDYYYDGKYKEYIDELEKAEHTLQRIQEDEQDMEKNYEKNINYWDQYDPDINIVKAYEQQLQNREEERKKYKREIEDIQKTIKNLKEKEEALTNVLSDYQYALKNYFVESDIESAYHRVLTVLKVEKVEDSEYEKAETTLKRAKEDRDILVEQGKEKIVSLEQQKELLEEKQKEIQEKKIELEKEQLVKEKGMDTYEKELTAAEEEVKNKERALESAKLQIEKAKEAKSNSAKQEHMEEKVEQLNVAGILLDLKEKKAQKEEIEGLLKKEGKVTSQIKGEIKEITFEEGSTITTQDSISVIMEGYELSASASEEQIKHFNSGDEIMVSLDERNKLTLAIGVIEKADKDNMCNFTIELPQEEEKIALGDSLNYEAIKKSGFYRQCVNINAIRQDTYGTYVLILENKNSVLGESLVAVKREVTILEKDTRKAAIESQITEEQDIVIGSNKNIEEGDRVRMDGSVSK